MAGLVVGVVGIAIVFIVIAFILFGMGKDE
jgi:hypothetical protein